MQALVDLFAPIRCASCGDGSDGDLCAACAEDVNVITDPICGRCGAPSTPRCPCRELAGFDRARSLVSFARPARALTLALKRRGRRQLARAMGLLLADLARREGLNADVVTYVPAGSNARRAGFDHAGLLGRGTALHLGLPIRPLLVRAADGPRQADVSMAERRSNVRGRFAARQATGGAVLLVDDVFTTGSTAEACSLVLRDAGAERVDVLTWARTLRRRR